MKTTDTENLITAMLPGGIEAQEKAGQGRLIRTDVLPKDGLDRELLQKLGLRIGEDADELFVSVVLPKGWKKQATDHALWSDLLDEKGRRRAAIFYKAAFYDRRAHMEMVARYDVGGHYKPDGSSQLFVKDGATGEALFVPGPFTKGYAERDIQREQCEQWLTANFPQHEDVTAYWD